MVLVGAGSGCPLLVVLLQRVLQLGGDLLEEDDLLAEVVLHLAAEVPYACPVEVLYLGQRGAGDDVAAVEEVPVRLLAVLHLGQRSCVRGVGEKRGPKGY